MQIFTQRNLNFLNAADFGASPQNAAAKNDLAFASALVALPASGGVIGIPNASGSYHISQPIVIDNDGVSLVSFGQRNGAAIIQVDPSVDPAYSLIIGNTRTVVTCLIAGLSFQGRNSGASTGGGILFRCNGGKIYQTKVYTFGGTGIALSSVAGTCFEVFFEDLEIVQNGMNATTPGDNITLDGNISDSEFHRVISSGDNLHSTTRHGINVGGAAYCKFFDCHAYLCNQAGLITNGQGTQVIGGEWENDNNGIITSGIQASIVGATMQLNRGTDVSIFSGPTTISSCQCISTATFANIYANNAQGGIVSDNVALGCPTSIWLDAGSSLYSVHDNQINATGTSAIILKSTNSDIHDNNVQGAGGGGIVEQTGAQGNSIHDNNLIGGGTITQIGTTTRIRNNPGFNPRGHAVTQPAIAASTVAVTNTTGCDCTVHVAGGTVTVIAIGGTATGATSGAFRVPVGQTITLTYSVAPTWQWFGD